VAGLIDADVEARMAGGSIVRGTLVEVGDRFLVIEKSTTKRRTFVALDHLAVLVDETPPGLAAAGRRAAESREEADR
jgi:hypothetical protein